MQYEKTLKNKMFTGTRLTFFPVSLYNNGEFRGRAFQNKCEYYVN